MQKLITMAFVMVMLLIPQKAMAYNSSTMFAKTTTNIYLSSTDNSDIIGNISFNSAVTVINTEGDYCIGVTDNGLCGYIYTNDLMLNQYDTKSMDVKYKTTMKSYESYTVFSKSSNQYELQQMATTDSKGLRKVNDRYCVALGTKFTSDIGQYFDLVLDNGVVIPCVLGDIKDDRHTDKTNTYTVSNGCVSEFIVDIKSLDTTGKTNGNVSDIYNLWDSHVVQIIIYDYNILG